MKNPLTIVIIAVAAWCGGIVLAPIVADTIFGTLLYRFYAVVCHQFESRSIVLAGNHMAVCARCTGIYAGFLIGVLAIRMIALLRDFRPHAITAIAVAVFPMILHVILETLNVIEPSLVLRIVTGLWSGAGLSIILHRSLTEIFHSFILLKNKRHETTTG